MLSGGFMEVGSKALQSFCLCYTCFILGYSYKVPAMSKLYSKPAGAEKKFFCNCRVCLPTNTTAPGTMLKNN